MPQLATLDEVKNYLSVTSSNYDVTLSGLINAVSEAIIAHTNRDFVPVDDEDRTLEYKLPERAPWVGYGYSVSRRHSNAAPQFIDLYPYEARAVTSVVIDPSGTSPLTLTRDQWLLEPIAPANGVHDRLTLAPSVAYYSSSFPRVPVLVHGDWGWPAVPAYVKDWVYEMIEDRFREDIGAYADADGNVVEPNAKIANMPITVPYRIQSAMDAISRTYTGSV